MAAVAPLTHELCVTPNISALSVRETVHAVIENSRLLGDVILHQAGSSGVFYEKVSSAGDTLLSPAYAVKPGRQYSLYRAGASRASSSRLLRRGLYYTCARS
eukprot:scaffold73693_cov33-Phaeocystis_antarctica.AAC.3